MSQRCHRPCDKQAFIQLSIKAVPSYAKPALPRLGVALINSHLRKRDEAKAGPSWLQAVAQGRGECFCFRQCQTAVVKETHDLLRRRGYYGCGSGSGRGRLGREEGPGTLTLEIYGHRYLTSNC